MRREAAMRQAVEEEEKGKAEEACEESERATEPPDTRSDASVDAC